jgi:hypothetical protein
MGIHGITFSLIALGGLFSGALAAQLGLAAAVTVGSAIILLAVVWVTATQTELRCAPPPLGSPITTARLRACKS